MALVQCPECGRDISDQAVSCPGCGKPIERSGPSAAEELNLRVKIETLMGLARTAEAAGNNEEAENYYSKVLELSPTVSAAWFGKGRAAIWRSTIENSRLGDMRIAFNHAIATAPVSERARTLLECFDEANLVVTTHYKALRNNMSRMASYFETWKLYVQGTGEFIILLEEISDWFPNNEQPLLKIVELCKDCLEGFKYNDIFRNKMSKVWHLTPDQEKLVRAKFDNAVNKIKQLDPKYKAPEIIAKEPRTCFVITATMGDQNHPTVLLMKDFRDQWLIKRKFGQTFIDMYYKYGPILANVIEKNKLLRSFSYIFIVLPSSLVAQKLLKRD